jgi:hypothetical protein
MRGLPLPPPMLPRRRNDGPGTLGAHGDELSLVAHQGRPLIFSTLMPPDLSVLNSLPLQNRHLHLLGNWSTVPNMSSRVLTWIRDGAQLPLHSVPSSVLLPPRFVRDEEAHNFLCETVLSLHRDGRISTYSDHLASLQNPTHFRVWIGQGNSARLHFIPSQPIPLTSPLGVVPKKDGGWRILLDTSRVNAFITASPFKYEHLDRILPSLVPGSWMVKIDMKDGFHHCRLHPHYRFVTAFQWMKETYVWNCLPFGLNCSPFIFVKTLRPALNLARHLGITLVGYSDDILIVSSSHAMCLQHRDQFLQILERLGWVVNTKKSVLHPTQEMEFLGFLIQTRTTRSFAMLTITAVKAKTLTDKIRWTLRRRPLMARDLASTVGFLQSVVRATFMGQLNLRYLYSSLNTRTSWESPVTLSDAAIAELHWWMTELRAHRGVEISHQEITWILQTDASEIGWGATLMKIQPVHSKFEVKATLRKTPRSKVLNFSGIPSPMTWSLLPLYTPIEAQGFYSAKENLYGQNYRESLAVQRALMSFAPLITNSTGVLRSDNMTTLAVMRKQGNAVPHHVEIARSVYQLLRDFHIRLKFFLHVPGLLNLDPDRLSRMTDKSDWKLLPQHFRFLHRQVFHMKQYCQVDRFASTTNALCPRFNSLRLCPSTEAVNSFTQCWSNTLNWINPPFDIIPRVVEKILKDEARGILITPLWERASWFPTLLHLSVDHYDFPSSLILFEHGSFLKDGFETPAPPPFRVRPWRL